MLSASIHAGVRGPQVCRKGDLRNDLRCGFEVVASCNFGVVGTRGVIDAIHARGGGDNLV